MGKWDFQFDDVPDVTDPSSGTWLGPSDAGRYHFIVQDADAHEGEFWEASGDKAERAKEPELILSVCASAPLDPMKDPDWDCRKNVGKSIRLQLPRSGKFAKRTILAALACGVVTHEQLKAVQEARKSGGSASMEINFDNAVGAHVFATVELDEYKDKNGQTKRQARIGWELYGKDDPKSADFPRDLTMCAAPGVADDPFGG